MELKEPIYCQFFYLHHIEKLCYRISDVNIFLNSLKLRAYDDYVAAHYAGDDGREDWEARKSCNYVNAAVGVGGFVISTKDGNGKVLQIYGIQYDWEATKTTSNELRRTKTERHNQ